MLLYVIGVLFLIAEIFIPSSGVLTVASLSFLGMALYRTFQASTEAGYIAMLVLLVTLPTAAYLSIKFWHLTPVGRRISPENPVLTDADTGVNLEELKPLIGARGRTLSPLRPVGTCEFNGRRIECVAEVGMIASGVDVRAIGINGRSLAVKPVDSDAVGESNA